MLSIVALTYRPGNVVRRLHIRTHTLQHAMDAQVAGSGHMIAPYPRPRP
jgi:hypothetical protein